MAFVAKKAKKALKKLRIGISAASGFGKTYGALLLAHGICKDWSKICVIDSENGSANLYDDLGGYDVVDLAAPYTPERYIEAIKQFETKYDVIIIDSASHEWDGEGGCLEIQQSLGGKYTDWKPVKSRHSKFIRAILSAKCHIICTTRRKQEFSQDTVNGRTVITKLGTKAVEQGDFEYELDVSFEVINKGHFATASKDRTKIFDGKPEFIITGETGSLLIEWANKGESDIDIALAMVRDATTIEMLADIYRAFPNLKEDKDLIEACSVKKQELIN